MNSTLRLHRALGRKGLPRPSGQIPPRRPIPAGGNLPTRGRQAPAPFDIVLRDSDGYVYIEPKRRQR